MITQYTTYGDVRGALGVTEDDIEDTTLSLTLYADHLQTELEDVDLDLIELWESVKAQPSPTAVQTRFLKAARLFATYAVAKHLTGSLPMFAARQVGDGKAVVQRFDTPYRDTVKRVGEQYDNARNRLKRALGDLNVVTSTSVTKQYFGIVTPESDPVTGASN